MGAKWGIKGDKVIWIIVILLSVTSMLLVYSSSSTLAFKEDSTNFDYLLKQVQFAFMGFVVLYLSYKIPLGVYRSFVNILFGLSLILLILTPIIGIEINHAKRWLAIGPVTFQPAEIAKITLIMYLAKCIENYNLDSFKEFFWRVVTPIGFVCLLILIGSVSTAIVMGIISLLVLIIAGVKKSHIFKSIGIACGAFLVAILLHIAFGLFPRFDTSVARIKNFFVSENVEHQLSAEERQQKADKTFQADMAEIAISSGKVFGKGPGKSTQRYVLPHPYSDFIYSIIIEEYGIMGGAFILLLYLQLLYRCVLIVKHCTRKFTAITVGGLGLMIVLQAFLHILVNVGIFPVTGHTLPLVSLGGTSFIIFCFAFGIILSVSKAVEREEAEKEKEEKAVVQVASGNSEEESDSEYKTRVASRENEEQKLHEIIDSATGEFK